MSKNESGVARRKFLRIAGMAGLGLGLQSILAKGVSPDFAAAEAEAEIVPHGDCLAGLDIGTCKVCVAVGEREPGGAIKIRGIGQAPSLGIRGGEIVDSEAATRCVREALVDAEVQSDVMIGRVQLAVYGGPGSHGLDRQAANSIRCVQNLGMEVRDVVFSPIASAQAVLDSEQMKLGALVIDIGAGTTSYAVYANGEIKDLGWSDEGGDNISSDLGLRFPMISTSRVREIEALELYWRVWGIFHRMKTRIETRGVRLDSLGAGVHLTGGCSLLDWIGDLAEEVFGIPAQLARVHGVRWALSATERPGFSCAIGLVKLGATDHTTLATLCCEVLPEYRIVQVRLNGGLPARLFGMLPKSHIPSP
jgi:cell division ATPase FtsA